MIRMAGAALVLILLGANSWIGIARIASAVHRFQADRALLRADLDGAWAHLGQALAWYPVDPTSNVQRGGVVQQALANGLPLKDLEGRGSREMLGAGVASIGRAIAMNPADAWGWFSLASLYQGFHDSFERLERMREAGLRTAQGEGAAPGVPVPPGALDAADRVSVAATLQALEAEPSFFFYHDFLAKLYLSRGLQEEAAREARDSMALTPRLAAHTVLLEDAFVETLSPALLEGIERAGENPFIGPVMMARARAELLNRLERFDEAIASYEELRRHAGAPLAQECDLAIGKLEQRKERWAESLPLLERAHERNPSSSHGISALYYMGLAEEKLGNLKDAARLFERHMAGAPEAIAGYHALARVKEALGDRREARRLYIAAVRQFPRNRVAYIKAIESLEGDGEYRQALLYAEALRHLEPGNEQVEALIRGLTEKAKSARRGAGA